MPQGADKNLVQMNDDILFSASQLSLVYRALPALSGIDWTVRRGEQWACLGPNGSGKTTLARILSGQAAQHGGELQKSKALKEQCVAYVCFEE